MCPDIWLVLYVSFEMAACTEDMTLNNIELGEWNMNGSHPICCNRNKAMPCVLPHLKRHWPPLVLSYGTIRGNAPPYPQAMLKTYTPTQVLRSATSDLLVLSPLREGSSRSAQFKLFSVFAPQCWNQLPPEARIAESPLKPYLLKQYHKKVSDKWQKCKMSNVVCVVW